ASGALAEGASGASGSPIKHDPRLVHASTAAAKRGGVELLRARAGTRGWAHATAAHRYVCGTDRRRGPKVEPSTNTRTRRALADERQSAGRTNAVPVSSKIGASALGVPRRAARVRPDPVAPRT